MLTNRKQIAGARIGAYPPGLILCLALGIIMAMIIPARAAASDFMDSGCESMEKLSPSEMIKLLADTAGTSPTDPRELYDEEPSFSNPYAIGKVKEIYLQKAVDRLNALRAIAGVPAAAMDSALNETGQYGAVVLGTEGVGFSHYPSKPEDMSDEFYENAELATRSSNIYAGRDLLLTPDGFMNDSDDRNVDKLGHRRWQLNPAMGKVGFGYVAAAPNTYRRYTAEMCHDRSASNADYNFISWPASGYFPNTIFGGNIAWSVTVNPARYGEINRANFRVVLTREADDARNERSWTFSDTQQTYTPASAGTYYNIETSWYGVPNCIIFRPDGIESYTGDWNVTIYGLKDNKGEDAELTYQVKFFDPANPPEDEPETWPEMNPDQPLKTAEIKDIAVAAPDDSGSRVITITAKSEDTGRFLIAAAAYEENGRLLSSGTSMADLSAEDSEIALTLAGSADAKKIKAFLIDSNRRAPGTGAMEKAVSDVSVQSLPVSDGFDEPGEILIPALPEPR